MPKAPEPPVDDPAVVDVDPEHEWRMRCLQAAGFTAFQAFRLSVLAAEGADWRQAMSMHKSGATFEEIYAILK